MRKMKFFVRSVILLLVLAVTAWPGNGFDLETEQARIDPNVFNFVRIRYNGFIGSWMGGRVGS